MQKTIVFSIVWLVVGMASPLSAGTKSEVRSLASVAAVKVVVEDLSRSVEQAGMKKEHLSAIAVQYLQQAGLTVLGPRDRYRVPLVYVRLSSVFSGGERNAPMSFYMTLHVKQFALLTDEQPASVRAAADGPEAAVSPLLVTTWENGMLVMSELSEMRFYMQQILASLLAELTQDWREANARVTPE